jgi:hypothetical protein
MAAGIALLAASCLAAAAPEEISGLEAWYKADSLQGSLSRDKPVVSWPDVSGNGHDLTEDQDGLPALFTPNQVNSLPTVKIQKETKFSIAAPIELGDFTIFLVYRSDKPGRALFRSNIDKFQGIIMRSEGKSDRLQISSPLRTISFGSTALPNRTYGITVLARQSDLLRSFLNGADISVGAEYSGAIAVGKFFRLNHNQYSKSDGEGLRIAEMLFYSRYLSDSERGSVTGYLAEKYAIDVEVHEEAAEAVQQTGAVVKYEGTSLAQLSTNSEANVNEGVTVVAWDLQDAIDEPFEHDTRTNNSKLTCTNDGTRVRLYVSLPVSSSVAGAELRVLFRINGSVYQRGEGRSGIFGRAGATEKRTVYSEVVATMNAGDYVEVVVLREGAEGTITIDASSAVFTAEVK